MRSHPPSRWNWRKRQILSWRLAPRTTAGISWSYAPLRHSRRREAALVANLGDVPVDLAPVQKRDGGFPSTNQETAATAARFR
jgi:hypothetical protein